MADEFGSIVSLKALAMNGCGAIPNLDFIRKLPELQNFRFVDTTVVDGDLTPLLKLQFVGFVGKKHYSHTPKQMDAILKQHGGSAP